MNKIKEHFKKHWGNYALGGIVLAGITVVIMKRYSDRASVLALPTLNKNSVTNAHSLESLKSQITDTGALKSQITDTGFNFNNSGVINDSTIVNVFEREGRGHPGYMVKCLENGLTYISQKAAAKDLEISPVDLSMHLNGRMSHVENLHFERIHMAA